MNKLFERMLHVILSAVCVIGLFFSMTSVHAEDSYKMWRLYNRNTGEHFYTSSTTERDNVFNAGWNVEGYGWVSPSYSNTPVYRMYNPNVGDHHYTTSVTERDNLVSVGWRYEGIGWYACDNNAGVPVYREYNPYASTGAHNFTTSITEHNNLIAAGWKDEGIAFYVLDGGGEEGAVSHALVSKSSIVDIARSWVGVGRYASGGTNPATGADCSGFTQYVYAQVGISINRLAHEQSLNGYQTNDPQPGDLVLWTGHAAIYSGNGYVINAMNVNKGIQEVPIAGLQAHGSFMGYYHVYGVE